MCARVFYNEDIGDNIFEKALILTRVSAPKVTCSSGEGIANPQTMRASFGEPQPLRMTRVVIVTFINRTTPPDCHGRGSGIATTEGSMSEMKVTILFLRAQILRWCSRMTARLVLIALSVVFIHERHRSELGEEMPRIARRDMFASGKRDIQKCDMFARLTRYALRASKAHEHFVRAWG